MPASRTDPHPKPRVSALGDVWLLLRVHLHALRHGTRPYLKALWWRLCGKRVRARAHFAPLLALSPLAYRLWLRGEERLDASSASEDGTIVALVDAEGAGTGALQDTLRSLSAESIDAVIVGTPQVPTLVAAAEAIAWSGRLWLLPLTAGDVLAARAGKIYRAAAAGAEGRIVYADDDLLDARGQRHTPHFKPQWNVELYRHFDYLTGTCIVRSGPRVLAGLVGPDWPARLVASVLDQEGAPPLHIPHVLHHRRKRPAPSVPAAPVVEDAVLPSISVIVPTRNRHDLLRTCIAGLIRTDYPDMEVIVIDNGSDDPATLAYLDSLAAPRHRVLRAPGPFNFSTLNNRAVQEAKGELLCLLNNDIEVIEPDWLRIMAHQALRPEVGAVGARLLYPDGRIQHAGVVLGVGGGAAHAHRLLRPDQEGYFRRHALPHFVSAVTAACLVVKRACFEAVGGLDEANFAVAFNDVDLCMRLGQRGWKSLYEPRATLVHHESVSRGFDRDSIGAARLARELAALQQRWNTDLMVDPYHHLHLDRFSERFVVRL